MKLKLLFFFFFFAWTVSGRKLLFLCGTVRGSALNRHKLKPCHGVINQVTFSMMCIARWVQCDAGFQFSMESFFFFPCGWDGDIYKWQNSL